MTCQSKNYGIRVTVKACGPLVIKLPFIHRVTVVIVSNLNSGKNLESRKFFDGQWRAIINSLRSNIKSSSLYQIPLHLYKAQRVAFSNGDDLDQLWKSCCAAFNCEVLNNVVTYIRRSRIVQSSSNREFYVDNFTRSYIFSYLWTGNEIVTDRVSWNITISTVSKLNKPPKSIRLASPRIQIRRFRDELRFFLNRRAV